MWKYIVTWAIITYSSGKCPEPPIKYDEFGRQLYREQRHLRTELCLIVDTIYKEKAFDTRIDAEKFIKNGKYQLTDQAKKSIGDLSLFKLDSIPLKQYDCTHPFTSITSVYCDPPQPNCNTATCQKCGKQWPSY